MSPLVERLMAKVQVTDGCWLWTGSQTGKGYGQIRSGEAPYKLLLAHRAAYELLVGPIPAGMQLDHLCRVPSCVRPSHLEPVTCAVNQQRAAPYRQKEKCLYGHALSRRTTTGVGWCPQCQRDRRARTKVA